MFKIEVSARAEKFLSKCEKALFDRIKKKLKTLEDNPVPRDSKRMKNNPFFRLRIGGYRILYEVDSKNNLIGIIRIDKRGRIYKRYK